MAEVLAVPQSEQRFVSSLRRNTSQPSLLDTQHTTTSSASNKLDYNSAYRLREPRDSPSYSSSAPSSPSLERVDFSNTASYLSTPSSNLSLEDGCEAEDEDPFDFPIFESSKIKASHVEHIEIDESLPGLSRQSAASNSSLGSSDIVITPSKLERTNSFTLTTIADDTAVKPQPTRHVDYLSHDWKEEDIWSSWRHIVGKRGEMDNWERLENASWRTWMKSQKHLSTINPDKLNWMKDHDVTWLYGPLQTGSSHIKKEDTSHRDSFSRTNSFLGKKPILKRRSVSEIMLQRSLSTQSLMKQATDAIRAQEATAVITRPSMGGRIYSDAYSQASPTPSSTRHSIIESPSPFTASTSSSGSQTPDDRRHIHFNETVEQCIAIASGEEPDYESSVIEEDEHSSDEEFLTMKTDRTLERKLSRNATPRGSFSEQGNKTIAMLPATTLKYRGDTPEPPTQTGPTKPPGSSGLHESSSQETLRPSHPSANFLLDEEDDEPMDPQWKRPTSIRKDSLGVQHSRYAAGNSPHPSQLGLDLYRDDNDELQRAGMRRTPSGMFMPYDEEGEASGDGSGLIGKVFDTYNTARDIAHVIWNVGWRR